MNDRLTYISPEVMQNFVEHFQAKSICPAINFTLITVVPFVSSSLFKLCCKNTWLSVFRKNNSGLGIFPEIFVMSKERVKTALF